MSSKNASLEDKVATLVEECAEGIAARLIMEGDTSNAVGLRQIVHSEYNRVLQHADKSTVAKMHSNASYTPAVGAMRNKAAELAPAFLTEYGHHLQAQAWPVRMLRLPKVYFGTRAALGFLVLEITYYVSNNLFASTVFGTAVFAASHYMLRGVFSLADRTANSERKKFEESVKAEFYRAARSS